MRDFDYAKAARLANAVQASCTSAAAMRRCGYDFDAEVFEMAATRDFKLLADELNFEVREMER